MKITRRISSGNITIKCDSCNNEFKCWKFELKRSKNHYCSLDCKHKHHRELFSGSNHPLFGKSRSEETKKKLKNFNLGRTTYRRGLTLEKEYGFERAKEIRNNMKESHKDQKMSEINKIEMSKRLKGKIPKHINKLIDSAVKFKLGNIPWNKGLTKNDLPQLQKLSDSMKEGRKFIIFPKKDTSIEIKIQNFLKELGYEFFTHKYIKDIEHGYQCDILIPAMNLVIECDGDYWHHYPIGRDIDHIRTSELLQKGFKVLRLWEFEIKKMELNNFKEKLQI